MNTSLLAWVPAGLLAIGGILTSGVNTQRSMPLRAPLETAVPVEIDGMKAQDIVISEEEQRVAGMDSYVMRVYSADGELDDQIAAAYSVYVGYYEQQTEGETIHSPRNCLPGAGWEALTATPASIPTANGPVQVTRYLLKREDQQALVLYWYQGRGRIESNEYVVKWDLLRDAALRKRSDEALVRIVVPVVDSEREAFALATRVATTIIPAVDTALPL